MAEITIVVIEAQKLQVIIERMMLEVPSQLMGLQEMLLKQFRELEYSRQDLQHLNLIE